MTTSTLTIVPVASIAGQNPTAGDLHRAVMGLFPDGLGDRDTHNILWRADGKRILVRSDIAPTVQNEAARSIPEPNIPFASGDQVRFTLTINPVLRHNQTVGPRVRRVETLTEAAPLVINKLALALHVEDIHSEVTWNTSRKGTPLAVTTVTGIATITDPDELSHLLRHGVGRAKAFGCGLLTVLPA